MPMANLGERVRRGWNAFVGRDQSYPFDGPGSGIRPDRSAYKRYSARSVMGSIYNRIGVDVASVTFNHVRLDPYDDNLIKDVIKSSLNDVLTVSANIDQTAAALFLDAVTTMFEEGTVALVPIDTSADPALTDSYDIYSVRIGRITQWYPQKVRVEVYNDRNGQKQEVVFWKKNVVIVENPFYSIMNEPNSYLQRLIRLLNQLDRTNEQNSSGKLDLIIQLPYVVRGAAKRREAEERRKDIESQLDRAQLGIAYIDGTEQITQLNRAVENNLWTQATDLETKLYNQLGLTKAIFDGTADEAAMLNYQSRTVEPIASAFAVEMERKWLSKTARTQHQAIRFHKDPFKLVPVAQIADIADKFTRNEILSSNELRSIIGRKPSDDPKASQLINSNLNHPGEGTPSMTSLPATSEPAMNTTKLQNGRDFLNSLSGTNVSALDGSSSVTEDVNATSEQIAAVDKIVEELLNSIEAEVDSIVDKFISGSSEGGSS